MVKFIIKADIVIIKNVKAFFSYLSNKVITVNKNPKEIDMEHINKCHPYSLLSKIKDDIVFFKKKVPEIKINAPSEVTIRVDEIIVLI